MSSLMLYSTISGAHRTFSLVLDQSARTQTGLSRRWSDGSRLRPRLGTPRCRDVSADVCGSPSAEVGTSVATSPGVRKHVFVAGKLSTLRCGGSITCKPNCTNVTGQPTNGRSGRCGCPADSTTIAVGICEAAGVGSGAASAGAHDARDICPTRELRLIGRTL